MSTLALTRRRTSMWSIVAVLAALATALSVYSYLSWLRSQIPVAGKLVPLVVASTDIQSGTLIDIGMLRMDNHPESYLPKHAFRAFDDVLGKVASAQIYEGEPLTQKRVSSTDGLSGTVPMGLRAYSIPVQSGLGSVPHAGDRVDVLVTFPREVLGEPTTITILSSKEVGAVAENRHEPAVGLPESRGALLITLLVTAEEAQRLAMAEALGRITVVLAPAVVETNSPPPPLHPAQLSK